MLQIVSPTTLPDVVSSCFRRGIAGISMMLAGVVTAHVNTVSAAEVATPAAVVLEAHGYGARLTDKSGMVLYTYARDVDPGKSKCIAKCTEQWHPVAAGPDDKAEGDWSKIAREDKSFQWAYRGSPLYSFTGDKRPGDSNGEGLERNAWKVAVKSIETPSGIKVISSPKGYVLADERGMTLYTSARDTKQKPAPCDVKCAQQWIPLLAPWTASSTGDWSVVLGKDGTKQWAYKDQPLYVYRGEVNPGETVGEGLEKNWHAVILEKPLPVPSWLTVQAASSDMNVYADPRGLTLYMHIEGLVGGGYRGGQVLRPQDWVPVVADAAAQPVGDWSIVSLEDGTHQWVYKGNKVYTNVNDTKAGDLNGVRRFDLTFRPISVTGKLIAGTGA